MLLFRQSLESQKSQVIPDDKLRGPFDNDDDQQKVTENLSFDSDYDIFIQKIDDLGCYDNLFRLKRFQSVLTYKQNKSNVMGMSVLSPMRNDISKTLLVTLHDDKMVRIWDLYETSFMKEIVCSPSNEDNPAFINRPQTASNKVAPDPQIPAVKPPDFRLTALTTYTPSRKHSEIGRKVIIGGGNDNSSFVIIYDEDARSSCLLFPFNSANHARYISCIVVVEAKINRSGDTESPIVVVASADKSFSVWDLKSRTIIFKTITKHTDMLLSITVLDWRSGNEGLLFITGGWDKNIFSYAWNSKEFIHNYKGHKKSVTIVYAHYLRGNSAMKNVECGVLITGSLDKTVIVWDVETKEKVRILTGHDGKITGLSIFEREEGSPPVIITCSEDNKTILWDLLSGEKMRELYLPEKVLCQSIMTNHYGMILLSGCAQGKAVVTNLCRTERIRKYFTKAVTAIATYTPRKDDPSFWVDEPTLLIGDINNSLSLYKLHSHKRIANVCHHHTSRINAAIIYTPPSSTSTSSPDRPASPLYKRLSDNQDNYRSYNPLVISCDGKAVISVWDLFESTRLVKSLKEHTGTVMTIALYEPHKCGKTVVSSHPVFPMNGNDTPSTTTSTGGGTPPQVDLSQPIIISGGSDSSLKFWYLLDESNKSFYTIPKAHNGMIRSIAMYHPTEGNSIIDPFFVTGSYDRCVAIWNLRTLTELFRLKMHEDYVFIVGLYDPFAHLGSGKHSKKGINESLLNHPVLVTSSYDKTLKVASIMNMEFNQGGNYEEGNHNDSNKSPVRPRSGVAGHRRSSRGSIGLGSVFLEDIHHLTGMHRDSVTAMTIYTPPNPEDVPLILSGSIDRMIIVWNLYTGEPLQKLIGHTDRVCYLTTYLPESGKNPLVFSGADDETTIAWEDALYPHSFMPLRDDVNRNFTSDCLEEDWPLITELANKYQAALFLVNANLFYLAIKYNRPDFIVKFQKYLSITLPLMHEFDGKNLLSYAVNSNDLLSVRTILSCWVENLNKDIHDVLTQRMYHASYFFPEKDLPLLAKKYPVEFKNFITSLRLIKNHTVLLLNDFETPAGNAFQQLHFDHHGKHVNYGNNNSIKRGSVGPLRNGGGGSGIGKLDKKGMSSSSLLQEAKVITDLVDKNGISYELLEAFESETLHAMNNTRVLRLHPVERYEVEATYNSIPKFNELWIKKFITTTYYDYFLSLWNEFVYELPDPQPITSLMVPLRNTATKDMIEYFVTVSNQLDNEEIFNSEVGYVSLRYFWDSKAKFYHLTAFAFHLILLLLYNIALYTFEFYYLKKKFTKGQEVASWILNVVVLLFFLYYLYEEIAQFLYEHQLKIRRETKMFYYSSRNLLAKKTIIDRLRDQTTGFSIYQEDEDMDDGHSVSMGHSPGRYSVLRTKPSSAAIRKFRTRSTSKKISIATLIRYFLEHFLLDLWNLVDLAITFTAGTGVVMRFIFNDDVPTGRAFLAVGSVLLWFKVLYFLRPFSNSGPLVTMIIQISYKLSSIRVFLFVLFCVLAGFTQAFWVLSNKNPNLLWGTVKGGFLTSFTYMLGQNVDASSVTSTVSPHLGVVLLVLFMLIMMLMMLNLLIALMGDAFAEVRAKGYGVWRKEQASIILEESFFFAKDTNRIPPYLHVLMYTSEVDVERKLNESKNGNNNNNESNNSEKEEDCHHDASNNSSSSPKKEKKA